MCGIAGIVSFQGTTRDLASIAGRMTSALEHRGPDASGYYNDRQISLGHRRLSVIDLGECSNQPLCDPSRRYWLVFNGEIYNYRELRKELTNYDFVSKGDSEVIIAAYIKWGNECVRHLHGMFAFAIWDNVHNQLVLARDRLGVKPLYYSKREGVLTFASEVRSLLKGFDQKPRLRLSSVREYLQYQTVYAPNTILEDVYSLSPGSYMVANSDGMRTVKYWDLVNRDGDSADKPYQSVCKDVYELLNRSVEERMTSDVPLGVFLSGGIDSSSVVAVVSNLTRAKVKTFSVTFDEQKYDESRFAELVSKRFGTEHQPIKLNASTFLKSLPSALDAMDHPTGDGFNTYVVSEATKKHGITVALSGIGGDELFGGYPVFKYAKLIALSNHIDALPRKLRRTGAALLRHIRNGVGSNKIAELLSGDKVSAAVALAISRRVYLDDEVLRLLPNSGPAENGLSIDSKFEKDFILTSISETEIKLYLQDILLRDTDQFSMAHALEIREPLLDHRLVEYVLSLPDNFKTRRPKKLLVDSLHGMLPDDIIYRKKMGFSFPWSYWLRHELRNFCEESLRSLKRRDIFSPLELDAVQERFFSGNSSENWIRIWLLVVLEHWIKRNLDRC